METVKIQVAAEIREVECREFLGGEAILHILSRWIHDITHVKSQGIYNTKSPNVNNGL